MNLRHRALLGAVALAIIAAPAYAQQSSTVTQADVQRLQDNVYLADRDLSQLRSRDATRATQLGTELDDLRDEVVYLKVKLRKERTLSRTEYADVRDRIEDLRSRARGDVAAAAPASTPTPVPLRRRPPQAARRLRLARRRLRRTPRPRHQQRRLRAASRCPSAPRSTFACRTRSTPAPRRLRTVLKARHSQT